MQEMCCSWGNLSTEAISIDLVKLRETALSVGLANMTIKKSNRDLILVLTYFVDDIVILFSENYWN